MSYVRILHLSDVHFGCRDPSAEQGRITDALVAAIHRFISDSGRAPDVVVFSGDLAHSGTAEEFDLGEHWLQRVLEGHTASLFVVPGNHDARRPPANSDDYQAAFAWRTAAAHSEAGFDSVKRSLEPMPHLATFFKWHQDSRARLRLLSDWKSPFGCAEVKEFPQGNVHFIGLNTVVTSLDDSDVGMLVADRAALNSSLRSIDLDRDLAVVVSHHPIQTAVPGRRRWLARWNDAVLGRLLLQRRGPQIYLHGHLHQALGYAAASTKGSQLLTHGAGAAYQGSHWPMSFAILDIDLTQRSVQPHVFGYHDKGGEWLAQPQESYSVSFGNPKGTSRRQHVDKAAPPVPPASSPRQRSIGTLLSAISKRALERYIPIPVLEENADREPIEILFCQLIARQSNRQSYSTLPDILNAIVGGTLRHWTVAGPTGAGKAEFLALLYWHTRQRGNGYQPVFVDLEHWTADAAHEAEELSTLEQAAAALEQLTRSEFIRPVLFVRGSGDLNAHSRGEASRFMGRIRELPLIVIESRSEGDRRRARNGELKNVIRLELPPFELGHAEHYIRTLWPIISTRGPEVEMRMMVELVATICPAHRIPLGTFLIRECIHALQSRQPPTTFGELLHNRFQDLSQEPDSSDTTSARGRRGSARNKTGPKLITVLSEQAFATFRKGSQGSPTRFDIKQLSNQLRQWMSAHQSVEHWLVASYILSRFEDIGVEMQKDSSSEKIQRVHAICADTEFVCPSHVNAFSKEVLSQMLDSGREDVVHGLRAVLCDRQLNAGPLLKANACYLVGRLPQSRARLGRELGDALRRIITEVDAELREVRAAALALQIAHRHEAHRMEQAFRQAATVLMDGVQHGDDVGKALLQLEKRLLLLQRSAYISLAYAGDNQAAEDYVERLLVDAQGDDTNRGFHLEYYGDVDYKPHRSLLSTDEDLLPCPNTIAALAESLESTRSKDSLAAIQAATLASLTRHRHARGGVLTEAERSTAVSSLTRARARLPGWRQLDEFLAASIAELETGPFVIERYVDSLYALKMQRRMGWGDHIVPRESVAAHSFFVAFLARLLVPEDHDVERISNLVLFHDLAEAIVSDIPLHQKTEQSRVDEAKVARRIALFGALTGSPTFIAFAQDFESLQNTQTAEESLIAQDLDRLDFLIQLMRYRRDNPDFPNYRRMRDDVASSKFNSPVIRKWAERFLTYFETGQKEGADAHTEQSRAALWPVQIVLRDL